MIMGDCPYDGCIEPLFIPCAEQTPAFERHVCEGCRGVIWTRHSRIDPWSMTEDEFLSAYEVDDETRAVRPRG